MTTVTKPTLHNGFKIGEALTINHRVERVFFTEVYSLSDGRFLYLFPSLKPKPAPAAAGTTL